MAALIDSFRTTWERLDARSLVDILIIALVLYWLFRRLRGTTAMALLRGIFLVLIIGFALS
ncbi:MAG: TIGR00159 family protein, partial [Chloroflexi bacterium]|nr:TIGR00159 family protein [Chloroflexota bacterium]